MKLTRIEFWIATAVCVFVMYMNLLSTYEPTYEYVMFHVVPGLLMILGTYFAFIAINNVIIPKHLPEKNWKMIVFKCTGTMVLLLALFTTADQLRPPGYPFRVSVEKSILLALPVLFWIACIFVLYILCKNLLSLLNTDNRTERRKLVIQILVVTTLWLIILLLLVVTDNGQLGPLWISAVPFSVIIYFLDRFWFLPEYNFEKKKRYSYFIHLTSAILVSWNLLYMLKASTDIGIMSNNMHIRNYLVFCLGLLAIALVWARFSYTQHLKQKEVISLKTDLGKSSADLQFLRSQINPHFLFNVLNTLYGTAIQEKAERTSEGIQKLGDMMRFMLYENTLDSIPVAREIDYLKDYIYLQKLRITDSPQITVEVNLPENSCHQNIAPMLLIPFIENAFKHGVSLQNRSWINISVHCEADRLDFDIYNSSHPKQENDTERFHGGIGLENVKQRLELLYPDKHELTIRQSQTEYFVHMTMFL
jgi:two-component system LytT family sensor kinase